MKKPINLKFKINFCSKLRKIKKPKSLSINGYSCQARYIFYKYYESAFHEFDITVYHQYYIRKKGVNYIKIYHTKTNKSLTKKELLLIYKDLFF